MSDTNLTATVPFEDTAMLSIFLRNFLNVPVPFGARSFSGRSGRFLPFEEAKEYVRTLQLSSATQWKLWATSGARPSYIPSAPAVVYAASGWVNYPDWLGYEKRLPWIETSIGRAIQRDQVSEIEKKTILDTPYSVARRGLDAFEDFLKPLEPALDWHFVGWRQQFQCLFRLPDTGHQHWSPLRVRVRPELPSNAPLNMGRLIGDPASGMILVLGGDGVQPSKRRFFFLPTEVISDCLCKYKPHNSSYVPVKTLLGYEVLSASDLFPRLREQYLAPSGPRRSEAERDSLNIHSRYGKDGVRFSCLREQLTSSFYSHLGRSVTSPMQRSPLWDTQVGSARVIHRLVTWDTTKGRSGAATIGLHRYIGGHLRRTIPLHLDDDFDVIIALDYDINDPTCNLRGAFIFSKSALKEFLASDDQPGRLHIALYSPRMPALMKQSQRRKQFSLRFYIDFSNPDVIGEQIEKAKAIFDGRVEVDDVAGDAIGSSSASSSGVPSQARGT